MKKYINTSNYYLSTTASIIQNNTDTGSFDVSDITIDWVALPLEGYYWVDVDFGDASKREIFRIERREWYTLFYDKRISPYWKKTHQSWASVGLRDFSQLLNSLSTNTDNFWEVEQTWDRNILVRGWKVFVSGKANASTWVINVASKSFESLPINSIIYIVLDLDEVAYTFESYTDTEYLTDAWQYPIAKITVGANMISEIEDLRSTMVYWWGEGDMKWAIWKEKYLWSEEATKEWNIYDMDNMEQGTNNLYTNPEEKIYWNAKQQQLVSWQNIVTINGKSIIDVSQWEWWNIPLDTILTAWWHTYTTEDWASSFTFDPQWYPLTEDAFIVFSDSGTMLTKGWTEPNDYTYSDVTHTITFNEPLADNEHAIIWTMYNNTDSAVWIWSWVITLQRNWETITNWQFNVNQDENQTIELWWLVNDSTITFTQAWDTLGTITTNQSEASSINVKWNIAVTEQEYEALLPWAETDGNRYFIYE